VFAFGTLYFPSDFCILIVIVIAYTLARGSYELEQVKKEARQTAKHLDKAKPMGVGRSTGGRDETTESDDVVVNLFAREAQRKLHEQSLTEELLAQERQVEEQKCAIVQSLKPKNNVHEEQKLKQFSAATRGNAEHARQQHVAHVHRQEAACLQQHKEVACLQVSALKAPRRAVTTGSGDAAKWDQIAKTGRHQRDDITQVHLTEVQSGMLESSVMRHAEERKRRRQALEERDKQETAHLYALKEAHKDDVLADEVCKQRALQRHILREKQIDLKTVADPQDVEPLTRHIMEVSHICPTLCCLRSMLCEMPRAGKPV